MSNIIFDFDGTIADSLPLVLELFYEWSKAKPFTNEQLERMRNMTLKEVINDIGIPLWRVPRLLVKARSQFGKRLTEVPIVAGMPATLKSLQEQGINLYVMSSNSPQNIRNFLKNYNINQYFRGIHGNTGLFGKTAALKAIERKYKLKSSDCYYIGDETRDIDAAKKAHIKCIAVSWGYNAEKILLEHNPELIAHRPSELLKLLQ